ncbi:MAG: DUF2587 domain-containing protein [Acidimicrobiia bacterium]|nr:DUF2587 domain-containing protein [Acidimicrobiia bacterium]
MTETDTQTEQSGEGVAPEVVAAADAEKSKELVPAGEAISQPAKLLRIAQMLRSMQETVMNIGLDEEGRRQLAEVQSRAVHELSDVMSSELSGELKGMVATIPDDGVPSESAVRIAQAQLVGWLEGLFQGIQASIAVQHMSTQQQLQQLQQARGEGPERFGTYL